MSVIDLTMCLLKCAEIKLSSYFSIGRCYFKYSIIYVLFLFVCDLRNQDIQDCLDGLQVGQVETEDELLAKKSWMHDA